MKKGGGNRKLRDVWRAKRFFRKCSRIVKLERGGKRKQRRKNRKEGSCIFLFSIERSNGRREKSIDRIDRIEVDGRFLQRR